MYKSNWRKEREEEKLQKRLMILGLLLLVASMFGN
jgi:hypothetical protein